MGQGEEEVAAGKEWVDARSDKVWHEDKKCAAQMLHIDVEARVGVPKSTIAETGMRVISRP